mmetsp:Transcript_8759/g.39763  ORF Transcript_8759/g.39763 Transcript_8759/m.39763 type:complete len:250 (-) Transcript_8759:608-1357(-)
MTAEWTAAPRTRTAPDRRWTAPWRRDLTHAEAHAPRSLDAASSRRRKPRGSLGSFFLGVASGFDARSESESEQAFNEAVLAKKASFARAFLAATLASFAAVLAALFSSSASLFSSRRLAAASARSLDRSLALRLRSASLSCLARLNLAMASKCASGGGGGSISTPRVSRTVATTRMLPSGWVGTRVVSSWKTRDLIVLEGSSSTSDSDESASASVAASEAVPFPFSFAMRSLFSLRICATRLGSRVSTS